MERQMLLPLAVNDQALLQRLWDQIPEKSRDELTEQYARLIAQAARDSSHSTEREPSDEISKQ